MCTLFARQSQDGQSWIKHDHFSHLQEENHYLLLRSDMFNAEKLPLISAKLGIV